MMKEKLIKTIGIVVCVVFVIVVFHPVITLFSAKQLVKAIDRNDHDAMERIIKWNPRCVNTLPESKIEKRFSILLDQPYPLYPLMVACREGDFEAVRCLVDAGADINLCTKEFSALGFVYSVKNKGWYQTSLYLIEHGAILDYDTTYHHVLEDIVHKSYAGGDNDDEVCMAFYYALEHCNLSDVKWVAVLRESVSADRYDIVEFILDKGYCSVNDSDKGLTALMAAARDSSPEMVQLLLDHGADKTMVDPNRDMTAYDYAIEDHDKEKANLLK